MEEELMKAPNCERSSDRMESEPDLSEQAFDVEETYQLYKQLVKDMEFVQMLADVEYLRALHIRGYFYDDKFLEYIKNLSYLFQKQYIKMIRYPEGLWNLKSLQGEGFIESTKNPETFNRFLEFCKARN